jgi:FSR family fosmidomycin resistance protein-like MFS transporter
MRILPSRTLPFSFGAMHAVVDFVSALVIYHAISANMLGLQDMFSLIVGYDVLAFGGQVFLGMATDRLRIPKPMLMAGFVFIGLSLFVAGRFSVLAAVFVGLGNALFHVGAGAMSLRINPGKAIWPGVFVGPGAIGLAIGIRLGKQDVFPGMILLGLVVLSVILALATETPQMPYKNPPAQYKPVRFGGLIVILLMATVFVRSVGGMVGGGYCAKTSYTALLIAGAAFLGKCTGGWIADRFGWLKTSLVMLLISGPLIAYGYAWLPVIIGGMFLFQMTMPVTLTAVAQVMPRRPATAFGLTCLALIIGALPSFSDIIQPYKSHHLVFGLVLFSAFTTVIALFLLRKSVSFQDSPI